MRLSTGCYSAKSTKPVEPEKQFQNKIWLKIDNFHEYSRLAVISVL